MPLNNPRCLYTEDVIMRPLQRLFVASFFYKATCYVLDECRLKVVTRPVVCFPLFSIRFPAYCSTSIPAMLPCLRRVLRPALSLRAGAALATAGRNHQTPAIARFASEPPLSILVQRCNMGTHPLNELVEPLDSPRGAKEFIYTLHPSERTCLLRELHKFESIAIAQGR